MRLSQPYDPDAAVKVEKRTDMYISRRRSYIEAMGGKLEVIARFPDGSSVSINNFASPGGTERANSGGSPPLPFVVGGRGARSDGLVVRTVSHRPYTDLWCYFIDFGAAR